MSGRRRSGLSRGGFSAAAMKRFRDRFPHMRKPVPKFNRAMHRGRTPPRMTAKITAPPGTSGGGEERDASEAGSEKSRPTNYGAADWSLFPRFEVRKRFATSFGQDRKAVPCLNGRTGANPKAASVERSPENCLRTVREYPVVRTTAPCRTPVKRCFRPGLPHCRDNPLSERSGNCSHPSENTLRKPSGIPVGKTRFSDRTLMQRLAASLPRSDTALIPGSVSGTFAPGYGAKRSGFRPFRTDSEGGGDRGAAFIHRYNTRTYDDSPLVSSVRRHRRKCVYGMRKHSFVLARSIRTVADETTTARTVIEDRSSGCFSFDYAMGPRRARAFHRRISVVHFRCGAFFRLQTPGRGGGYSTVTDLARLRG